MARWRLKEKHYLKVPGTEWEYRETTQAGRQGRKIFEVPAYLDPDDPSLHNYPGEIIVSHKPYNKDIVFVGPPTPDMEPLDDEAKEISEKESKRWIHPIESLPGNFSQSLLEDLERQVSELQAGQRAAPVSGKGVDPDAFAKMQEQMAELMNQNAKLQAQLAEKPARRV